MKDNIGTLVFLATKSVCNDIHLYAIQNEHISYTSRSPFVTGWAPREIFAHKHTRLPTLYATKVYTGSIEANLIVTLMFTEYYQFTSDTYQYAFQYGTHMWVNPYAKRR